MSKNKSIAVISLCVGVSIGYLNYTYHGGVYMFLISWFGLSFTFIFLHWVLKDWEDFE